MEFEEFRKEWRRCADMRGRYLNTDDSNSNPRKIYSIAEEVGLTENMTINQVHLIARVYFEGDKDGRLVGKILAKNFS